MNETTVSAGYYVGGGYTWEPGEIPLCSMCGGRVATRATAHSGVILCDNPDCHCLFVMQECHEIEYFEADEDDEEDPDAWRGPVCAVAEAE